MYLLIVCDAGCSFRRSHSHTSIKISWGPFSKNTFEMAWSPLIMEGLQPRQLSRVWCTRRHHFLQAFANACLVTFTQVTLSTWFCLTTCVRMPHPRFLLTIHICVTFAGMHQGGLPVPLRYLRYFGDRRFLRWVGGDTHVNLVSSWYALLKSDKGCTESGFSPCIFVSQKTTFPNNALRSSVCGTD